MNRKKIYLFGISGVYNYGCEAMVRSISSCIESELPDSEVIYKTYDIENDKKILCGCDTVKLESVRYPQRSIVKRIIRYTKRKIGMANNEDYLSIDLNWTDDCDALIIIGGDVFDLAPHQFDKKFYDNSRVFVSNIVKKKGGKVFLWGISVGNFEKNKYAKAALINYFKDTVEYAIIRDKKSYEYLKSNGVRNISLCSDPAFIQRGVQREEMQLDKSTLGINLSPLSNKYLKFNKSEGEWIEYWGEYIINILDTINCNQVCLIPHVVSEKDQNDDDYRYLKKIYEYLEKKKPNINIELVPKNIGFIGIKKYLIKCDMIISARMHCAINAITCGVPTIFLSYSTKSVGMCEHVYGNDSLVIDMNKEFSKETQAKIQKIWICKEQISNYLKNKNLDLYKDAKCATRIIVDHLRG